MILLPFFSAATWTLIVLFITLLLLYGMWPFNFFKKLGIPGPRPLPFIGTIPYAMKGLISFESECKNKYGDVYGLFDGRSPLLIVSDPTMIKAILVKECYSTFTNRRDVNEDLFGPLADAITSAKDEQWKRIRSTISPSFTSGRLRQIFPIVERYADRLIRSLDEKNLNESIEIKHFIAPYSLDVVTSASFSVDTDTTNHPDDPLSVHIKRILKMKFWLFFVCLVFPFFGKLVKLTGYSIMDKASVAYFFNLIKRFKEEHNQGQTGHGDFLQLMIQNEIPEIKDGKQPSKGLTDHEILSQAFIYIFGGYDTTSTTLSYILYNLALNPDALHTLQQEIDAHFPKETPVSYEALMNLEYLEQVISESMRLLPTAPRLERVCKQTVQLSGITIPEGCLVAIPVYTLQRDPRFWKSPDTFKPERFSKENADDINPYAYMPFGLGPRNCVGMRFAQMVVKMVLVRLLQDYSVETCKDTVIPLEFNWTFQPKEPIKLNLRRRA